MFSSYSLPFISMKCFTGMGSKNVATTIGKNIQRSIFFISFVQSEHVYSCLMPESYILLHESLISFFLGSLMHFGWVFRSKEWFNVATTFRWIIRQRIKSKASNWNTKNIMKVFAIFIIEDFIEDFSRKIEKNMVTSLGKHIRRGIFFASIL